MKFHKEQSDSYKKDENELSDNQHDIKILSEAEIGSETNRNQFGINSAFNNGIEISNSRPYKKNKKLKKYYFSAKYTIFLITIWLVFLAAFIVGFIINFDVDSSIKASSIVWSFSAFIFIIAILYTIFYYKAKTAKSNEHLQKYLRLIPF